MSTITEKSWQPIETAPKNGSEVIIRWNSADGIRENRAVYNGEVWICQDERNWINGFPLICRRIIGWLDC